MATATTATPSAKKGPDGLQGIMTTIHKAQTSALESVKDFTEKVNASVPDLGEPGPRARIIDAAFTMTGQIVDAGNDLALKLVDATERTVRDVSSN